MEEATKDGCKVSKPHPRCREVPAGRAVGQVFSVVPLLGVLFVEFPPSGELSSELRDHLPSVCLVP